MNRLGVIRPALISEVREQTPKTVCGVLLEGFVPAMPISASLLAHATEAALGPKLPKNHESPPLQPMAKPRADGGGAPSAMARAKPRFWQRRSCTAFAVNLVPTGPVYDSLGRSARLRL